MRFEVAVLFLLAVPSLMAQVPGKSPTAVAGAPASSTVKDLPVRQVILYKNGVGYFEHSGAVTGNQHVAIDFTSSQLNDVLQSLTVLDENGGRIGGVNYNSTTPLAEQLKSLSLAMSDDPSSTELFQALRGQRVEVTGAPGGSLTGRLMSIESRSEKAGDANATTLVDRYYLTIVTTAGAVRVVELTPGLDVAAAGRGAARATGPLSGAAELDALYGVAAPDAGCSGNGATAASGELHQRSAGLEVDVPVGVS